MPAQSIFSSMSAIQQYQLVFLCSIFLTQFFLTWIFMLFFCYLFVWLISFLCLRFWSNLLSQTAILSCVMLCWEVSYLFCFSSCFVFLFEISVKLTATSCYSISCSIFRKDFLFAFSNFQFRSTNFFSVCIQHMRVNLANLISKDLISSANQIQLKVSNQL